MDQKIMETYLTSIQYTDNRSNVHKIDLTFEDVLFIDTTRKSILICLKIYQINHTKDVEAINSYLNDSQIFQLMKGHESIIKMIQIIGSKSQIDKKHIVCV